jgi:ubiquinone/menaquinone biosynthesis C-methylase UbiE
MKDNFSANADHYARFRPHYPDAIFTFLLSLTPNHNLAWDCGTGNGQVAAALANYFKQVYATDISAKQIENADKLPNIIYKIEAAENTSFKDNVFDLITVAQAIHWFSFDEFYKEVNRTIKPGGILAVIGYGLFKINAEIDLIISEFYHKIIGPFWDKERRYIDEDYMTIPFPFKELESPKLIHKVKWNLDQTLGYVESWSAVQHYKNTHSKNPVELIHQIMKEKWGDDQPKEISFPILLRTGIVLKD